MTSAINENITGVILVGGKSRRMGQDKAFLKLADRPLLETVLDLFKEKFSSIMLAGDRAERFSMYDISVVPDIFPGSSLGGIHAALFTAKTGRIFVAPCDMPFPNSSLINHICSISGDFDAIVPISPQGYEPLYALYSKACLEPARKLLENDNFRITDLFSAVKTRFIEGEELASIAGAESAFLNINTPAEFKKLTEIHLSLTEAK